MHKTINKTQLDYTSIRHGFTLVGRRIRAGRTPTKLKTSCTLVRFEQPCLRLKQPRASKPTCNPTSLA